MNRPGAMGPGQQHGYKGRGAVSKPAGRFEVEQRIDVDDGWQGIHGLDATKARQPGSHHGATTTANRPLASAGQAPRTDVRAQLARSAISYNSSPDVFFDRSVNPYRGCEHGCIYCYARPGHAYEGLSPGIDFETRLIARTNIAEVLARELDAKKYRCAPINIGSVTDAYQPIERRYQLTRQLIATLVERAHPFTVITKNALIERDIDLLAPAAAKGLVACYLSVTTLNSSLARLWEPRASAPWRRIKTIRTLSEAGIPVGLIVAPIVPFINDDDLESIVAESASAGAVSAHYTLIRLPNEVREIFLDWLQTHFPDRAARVVARIVDMRGGGRLNDPRFVSRMRGQGVWAKLIGDRFRLASKRHGLRRDRTSLNVRLFAPAGQGQHRLFSD